MSNEVPFPGITLNTSKVSRVEVINYPNPKSGYTRDYVYYLEKDEKLKVALQDDNRTLKIFIDKIKQDETIRDFTSVNLY